MQGLTVILDIFCLHIKQKLKEVIREILHLTPD